MWKIGELSVAVTLVGKTLVHYKRYKVKRPGNPNTMSSKLDLQKYLLSNKAVRCWGIGDLLGYGNESIIGDNEAPEVAGDVPIE